MPTNTGPKKARGGVTNTSLGSCGHLRLAWGLTRASVRDLALVSPVAFTVLPCCSPLDLVRSWCAPRPPVVARPRRTAA